MLRLPKRDADRLFSEHGDKQGLQQRPASRIGLQVHVVKPEAMSESGDSRPIKNLGYGSAGRELRDSSSAYYRAYLKLATQNVH